MAKLMNDGQSSSPQLDQPLERQNLAGENQQQAVFCMNWNKQGDYLLVAGNVFKIYKFDSNQREFHKEFEGNKINPEVFQLKFWNSRIFGALSSNHIQFWDLRCFKNKIMAKDCIYDHQKLNNVAFDWRPHSSQYLILDHKNNLTLYDCRYMSQKRNSLVVTTMKEKNHLLFDIKWNSQGTVVIGGGQKKKKGLIKLYDENLQTIYEDLYLNGKKIISVAIDSQQKYLVTLGEDSLAIVNSLPDILCKKIISLPEEKACKICEISSEGKYLSVGFSNKIRIYDIEKKNISLQKNCESQKFEKILNCERLNIMKWHPKKNILAYCDTFNSQQIHIAAFE